MIDRGERPPSKESAPDIIEIDIGETLYTADGTPVGTIRGIESGGMFVTTRRGVEALSVEHVRSGHALGEAELVWRCIECGEMGPIDGGIPESCPGCGMSRENLMYWTED